GEAEVRLERRFPALRQPAAGPPRAGERWPVPHVRLPRIAVNRCWAVAAFRHKGGRGVAASVLHKRHDANRLRPEKASPGRKRWRRPGDAFCLEPRHAAALVGLTWRGSSIYLRTDSLVEGAYVACIFPRPPPRANSRTGKATQATHRSPKDTSLILPL